MNTPGPWTRTENVINGPDGRGLVAVAYGAQGADGPDRIGNARLIAAAPDLADALTNAIALFEFSATDDPQRQWIDDARAALRRAGR